MKLFAEGILARKKIVLIFFLAILLPALVVGTMSLGAYSNYFIFARTVRLN